MKVAKLSCRIHKSSSGGGWPAPQPCASHTLSHAVEHDTRAHGVGGGRGLCSLSMSEQGVERLIREASKRMFKNNQFLTRMEQAEAPLVSRTGVQVLFSVTISVLCY